MTSNIDNARRALEAEGWSEEEIREAVGPVEAKGPNGIPPLYREIRWDSIDEDGGNAEAIRAARRWASGDAPDPGLFLWSEGYGNSKTMIAAAAARQAFEERRLRIRWLKVVRLMTDLNLSFNNPQYERAADRLQPPAPGEVVVLDDLDKVPATDRNIQPIFALVNDCVDSETPLILTANRHLDALSRDFGDRFGRAMASRLVGHCLDVEVRGRDRRVEP